MKILKTFKKDNILFNKGSIFDGTVEDALNINSKIPNAIEVLELEQPKPKRKRNKKG